MHNPAPKGTSRQRAGDRDPVWVQWLLISGAVGAIGLLIVIPVINVFVEAFSNGVSAYFDNFFGSGEEAEYTRASIWLTLTVAPVAVILNVIFGIATAWAVTRFDFPGKPFLVALIDLPFAISPVVAGLMIMLIFGLQGWLGPWLRENHIAFVFAWPGIVLATTFVTMPFVARELIPVMEALGSEEEIAGVSLGANAWQLFWRVTLPNIKWALLYGIILCNARAMGEFGAVYVVSGRITGETDTMPIRIEKLLQDFNQPGAFAIASVLTLLALVTLGIKTWLEFQLAADLKEKEAEAEAAGQ